MNAQVLESKQNQIQALVRALSKHIISRSYQLSCSASLSLYFATLLFAIRELQILTLLRIKDEQSGQDSLVRVRAFFNFVQIAVLQFSGGSGQGADVYVGAAFVLLQLISIIVLLGSWQRKQINDWGFKLITLTKVTLPIPITLLLFRRIAQGMHSSHDIIALILAAVAFLLMALMQATQANYHFYFSLRQTNKNALTRFPGNIVNEIGWILFAVAHNIAQHYAYPTLFIVYQFAALVWAILEIRRYAVGLEYLDARMNKVLGILGIATVAVGLGVLSYYLNFALYKNSLPTFVGAFFVFCVNFFVTFHNYWVKKIIIDEETPTQISRVTYVATFIAYFCDIAQRKNQTYISSLLKNHSNNCEDTACCCQNRDSIYDPSTRGFGQADLQPHLDWVFIKHFYLKLIEDSIAQFPKSVNLRLMLALFYLQFLESTPECIKQVKYFNRKSTQDKMTLQQKYALFCLEQELRKLIYKINKSRGDAPVEKAKLFDELFNTLVVKVVEIVENFRYFWDALSHVKFRQKQIKKADCAEVSSGEQKKSKKQISILFLNSIAQSTLDLMAKIQDKYNQMKALNPFSSELSDVMLFYAKEVVNDIDLYINLKQDIKMLKMNSRSMDGDSKRILNPYGPCTANLVVTGVSKILWASNNARQVFRYPTHDLFTSTPINNLMPAFFGRNHDNLVNEWLRTGRCTKMNNTAVVWCRKQSGACFRSHIYMKVLPSYQNPVAKDIEYYVCIRQLSGNEIVCGADGEIYGCDENFQRIIKLPIRHLQDYRPNIQIFFPSLFHLFIPFFHKSQRQIELRKVVSNKSSGYIPDKISNYLESLQKEKEGFLNKNRKNKNFLAAYCSYIETKMQEVTVQIKGRYIAVDFQVERVSTLGRDIYVLSLAKIEYDAVEKYYTQFEKLLKVLSALKEKEMQLASSASIGRQADSQKVQGKPLCMDIFLNPRRLKRLSSGLDIKVAADQTLGRRKKRALNQLERIKSPRVREILYRIKKLLYEHKVFSANTLRILTESKQQEEYELQYEIQSKSETIKQKSESDSRNDKHNQRHAEAGEANSDNELAGHSSGSEDSQKKISFQNTGASFKQSTTSSAAFISLSSRIQQLKRKLRSVNPSKLLLFNTYSFIALLVVVQALYGAELLQCYELTQTRRVSHEHLISSYRLSESLMAAKIVELAAQDPAQSREVRGLFQEISYGQLVKNSKEGQVINEQQIQPSYLQVTLHNTDPIINRKAISLGGFYLKQLDALSRFEPSLAVNEYLQIINKMQEVVESYYRGNKNPIMGFYILAMFGLMHVLTLATFHRGRTKLHQIRELLNQLYPHEKSKYLRIYSRVSHKVRLFLELGNELAIHKALAKQKPDMMHLSSQPGKQSRAFPYGSILAKIFLIFGVVYLVIGAFHIVKVSYWQQSNKLSNQYDMLLVNKMKLSYRLLALQACNGSPDDRLREQISGLDAKVVPILVDLYNNPAVSAQIRETARSFNEQNVCPQLEPSRFPNISSITVLHKLSISCQQIQGGLFQQGILNSFSYLSNSITFQAVNPTFSNLTSQLADAHTINSLLTMVIAQSLNSEKQRLDMLNFYIRVGVLAGFTLLGVLCLGCWLHVQALIAHMTCMFNCYLLMVPFQVLIENPYIRQYLKNELNIKSSNY